MRKYSVAALMGWTVVRIDHTIATKELLWALNRGNAEEAAAILAAGKGRRNGRQLGEKGRAGDGAEGDKGRVHKAGTRPGDDADGVCPEGEGEPVRVRHHHSEAGDVRPQR